MFTLKQKDFSEIRFKDIRQYFKFTNPDNYKDDFGHIISHVPIAVFTPPTVEILQQYLVIASKNKTKITCRGKGNSAYGQSLVKDGVVIDLKNLEISMEYHANEFPSLTVPAFKTWGDVTEYTKKWNKTVPITVDNLDLTIGGTLSLAALGGTSYRLGCGADNVLLLDVVTMDGKRYKCSKTENKELFDAVLCGLGQFGIIISATIPLVTAKKQVNMHLLSYDNPKQFLQEQKKLYHLQIFDHLKGFVRKKGSEWEYVIEAVSYYDLCEEQSITAELKQLSPNEHTTQTMTYWEFINMVTGFVKALREAGKLDAPHPWYNVLMPDDKVEEHLAKALDSSHLTGTEPIIIYPMNSDHFQQPLFIKPDCKTFYLLGVLYNTSFEATNSFPYQEILDRNKTLYLEAKQQGGTRYPTDAIPFTEADWADHYDEKWQMVCSLKEKYDPDHLLSTGFNIFKSTINYEQLDKQFSFQ